MSVKAEHVYFFSKNSSLTPASAHNLLSSPGSQISGWTTPPASPRSLSSRSRESFQAWPSHPLASPSRPIASLEPLSISWEEEKFGIASKSFRVNLMTTRRHSWSIIQNWRFWEIFCERFSFLGIPTYFLKGSNFFNWCMHNWSTYT